MNLIKSAIVYKAEIPSDTTLLHNHLAEHCFTDPLELQTRSVGFVPVTEGCNLVSTFDGGLAFRVRIDEKIIPAGVVNDMTAKLVAKIKQAEGRKVGKKEKADIKDGVITELCRRALVRTVASITCFYDTASGYLIIPTTSKKIADICVSQLVQAVGSVKTETIHVSDVKHGLTTRLTNWLGHQSGEFSDGDAFGPFQPCDEAALADGKRKISVKMSDLEAATRGLTEALASGFKVKSLGFVADDGTTFRLTDEFRLRGIDYAYETPDADDIWAFDAATQVKAVTGCVATLVDLLAYKAPDESGEAIAAASAE